MFSVIRLLEHVHGHIALLSAGLALHPAVLVRQPKRRSITFLLAPIFLTLTSLLGAYIYGDYRVEIRQPLFLEAPAYGWMFERKEHLAFFATLLSWVGFFSPSVERQPERSIRSLAFRISAVLVWIVVVIGTAVAVKKSF